MRQVCDVELLSLGEPDPYLAQSWDINRIVFARGQFPKQCHLVFPGGCVPGNWIYFSRARVVSLIANTLTPERLPDRVRRWRFASKTALKIFYVSNAQSELMPYSGDVITSPVDIERFAPVPSSSPGLRIGRLSRNKRYKHGAEDPDLYRYLAQRGWSVHIRGGTCLADELSGESRVVLKPESPLGSEAFLQGLDVFFYRTRDDWFESFGRVVLEALACGVPVVAQNRGGYAELIEHGRSGFLFDTDEQARSHLDQLQSNPRLLDSMKQAARSRALEFCSRQTRDKLVAYFTSP